MEVNKAILKRKVKNSFTLLKNASKKYKKDDPVRLAGTTAYFMVFAMAPILIIIISVIGLVMGEQDISEKVFSELQSLIGTQGTDYVRSITENFRSNDRNILGTIVGAAIFLVTSTTFFTVLQKTLNFIWRIRAKPKHNLVKSLKDRLLSFGLILSMGFVLLVSLVIESAISFFQGYLKDLMPQLTVVLVQTVNIIINFGIVMLIFAMIYRFLPDARIRWSDTWFGAFITTLLFTIGKYVIGITLGSSNIGVMYGAAGSLVVILLWVFYSSIIFFYGAEITQQYAKMYGHEIVPKDYAVEIRIDELGRESGTKE